MLLDGGGVQVVIYLFVYKHSGSKTTRFRWVDMYPALLILDKEVCSPVNVRIC